MPAALELDYGADLAREGVAECVRDKQHQAWNKAKRTGRSAFRWPDEEGGTEVIKAEST